MNAIRASRRQDWGRTAQRLYTPES
jgi:hypothetical protein